jgi:hypothetical protein
MIAIQLRRDVRRLDVQKVWSKSEIQSLQKEATVDLFGRIVNC